MGTGATTTKFDKKKEFEDVTDIIDLGCGSGISSLAALSLNAQCKVLALDLNPQALELLNYAALLRTDVQPMVNKLSSYQVAPLKNHYKILVRICWYLRSTNEEGLKYEVVGISKDNMNSHIAFKKKYKVLFNLLSDEKVKVQKKLRGHMETELSDQNFQHRLTS